MDAGSRPLRTEAVRNGGGGKITFVGKFRARFARDSDGSWKWPRLACNWDAPVGGWIDAPPPGQALAQPEILKA